MSDAMYLVKIIILDFDYFYMENAFPRMNLGQNSRN